MKEQLQYCQNCGAELRCADDIGEQWVETESRPVGLIGQYEETEIEMFLCYECNREREIKKGLVY